MLDKSWYNKNIERYQSFGIKINVGDGSKNIVVRAPSNLYPEYITSQFKNFAKIDKVRSHLAKLCDDCEVEMVTVGTEIVGVSVPV